jgi:hypothetical protein
LRYALDSASNGSSVEVEVRLASEPTEDWVDVLIGPAAVRDNWPLVREWTPAADGNLYLARALIEAHGGTLSSRHTHGPGLHLRMSIPRHDRSLSQQRSPQST